MKRTYVTTTEVVVEANNKDEAHDIVYNNLGDLDIYRLESNNLEEAEMEDEIFEIVEIEQDVLVSSAKVIKYLQDLAEEYCDTTEYEKIVTQGILLSIDAIKNRIISDQLNNK